MAQRAPTRSEEKLLKRLGSRVRTLREAARQTQESLAEKCDLHPTYISSVERGERNVSLLNLAIFAKALGVPLSKLLDGVER